MLSFKLTFSLSTFTFIKRLFSSSSLSAIRVVSSAYLTLLIFLLAILIPACASSCPALQVSQEAGQVVWYSRVFQNFPQFIMIHTVKGFGIVNEAEIDIFLELSCFFDDPADVGNLISGSSRSSKTSLNIWKFAVHVLLKPGLENFEHYFTNM